LKILHVFSNWKWTGPAEPALDLACRQLKEGLDVTFACAVPPDPQGYGLADKVRERSVPAYFDLRLNKHFNVIDNSHDIKKLTAHLKEQKFDILHAHTANDHFVGGAAAKLRSRGPHVVRTSYEGSGLPNTFRNRFLLHRLTDAYIASSLAVYDADQASFELGEVLTRKIAPAVDCDVFTPALRSQSLRPEFGVRDEEICIGIVARIQRHRRFDVLLRAWSRLAHEIQNLRFVIIGRGTHAREVVIRPAAALGLADRLVMTGYRYEDFPRALGMLDIKVFLVPGSDGSCRAVRQAQACGIPVVAADRGMLAEIVEHEGSGFVVEDSEQNLYESLRALAVDEDLRHRLGGRARERAESHFSLSGQERQVRQVYTELLKPHDGS
jgi:glycosyltransferase involved in cell wall biosynthesis